MLIKIVTYDMTSHDIITEMHCNIIDPNKQDWLLNHLIWAANKKHGVQIINNAASDDADDIAKQGDYEEAVRAYRAANGLSGRDAPQKKTAKAEII